jgi:hypothetical protein
MDIIIKESGVAKPLIYVDSKTGTECTKDVLNTFGVLTNGCFTLDEASGNYIAPLDDYNWWKEYLAMKQEEEKTLFALCNEFGEQAVSQIFMQHQHLLNTDVEHEHEAMEQIFALIRTQLSQDK